MEVYFLEKEKTDNKSFLIQLAGHIFEIEPMYEYIKTYCKDYLVTTEYGYKWSKSNSKFYIHIKTCLEDIEFERDKSKKEDIKEGILIRQFSNEYLETLAIYRKIADALLKYNIILFHGSVIAVDGEGYLFTARSGTGKSTHTRLWKKYFGSRAIMVNDDKPLLKIEDESVIAYGTPWNGKHHLSTNIGVPLQAICVLNRDTENHMERLSNKEAYPMIIQQTNRSLIKDNMLITLHHIDKMINNVPIYKLGCNMELNAVEVAYKEIQKNKMMNRKN